MMRMNPSRVRRGAFTLIELLVVISIIAVLMAITVPAVFKMIGKGPEAQARAEIDGLALGIGAFKAEFNNVAYVPSRIRLRENTATTPYNMADPLDKASVGVLQKMFGSRFNPNAGNHDWNGDGTIAGAYELSGQECLVFFLGGIPSPSTGAVACTGFASNPERPTTPGGTRKGPFFDFKNVRLQRSTTNANFLVYLDAFANPSRPGVPYAYFSSSKSGNDFNRFGTSDCAALGVSPYSLLPATTPVNYLNPNGFQIISAGQDGRFGPGGGWDPKTGTTDANGKDDLSNFSRGRLGTGQH